jgi:hypothetical protein
MSAKEKNIASLTVISINKDQQSALPALKLTKVAARRTKE